MGKAIMIQGTASNAGKSLIAAGLCRVFRQDGHRVAPFKSQNMALNSFVTAQGLEMGRAQVVQAECAGVEPDVRMNPILLKPTSDSGSQVIVGGEVVGAMPARDYYAYKEQLREPVLEAFRSLRDDHDIVVLEGAGSPAEINLKEGDLVNMGMARMAGAPVLLVGDIDRGGVFASLAGTNLLFEPWERALLRGMIINKFRGDASILRPGLAMLEQLVGKPVLGVVPVLDVDIDDEDSLSGKLEARAAGAVIDVAVIRLPRISNFTDFAPLGAVDGVGVRYVTAPGMLGAPDLVILPGTKSTLRDLLWLRESGLEAAIQKHAAAGGAVLGICGGYQMLGELLSDPHGVEGGGELRGMGLLPVRTVFEAQKTRRQVRGRFLRPEGLFAPLAGQPVTGYEIHMGSSSGDADPLLELEDAAGIPHPDGAQRGNTLGCYLHGLFDEPAAAQALVRALAAAKGIDPAALHAQDLHTYKEAQYDKLADGLRAALDMEKVYQIIEQGAQ